MELFWVNLYDKIAYICESFLTHAHILALFFRFLL